MVKNTREALEQIGFSRQILDDGSTIKHKYRRGVTGQVKVFKGDYCVLWSDAGGDWEVLHAGDVGGSA